MNYFWSEISEHFQSALKDAERLNADDLQAFAEIPELHSCLKQLEKSDLELIIQHVRKVKSQKEPHFKSLIVFFNRDSNLSEEDRKMFQEATAKAMKVKFG